MSELVVVYLMNLIMMSAFAIAIRSVNKGEKGFGSVLGCTLFAALFAFGNMGLNFNNLVEFAPPVVEAVGVAVDVTVESLAATTNSLSNTVSELMK